MPGETGPPVRGNRAVRVDSLLFRWPGSLTPCLDVAVFEALAGESVFVHGASGSGKSTLLALLGGVLATERGTLKVLGTELSRLSAAARDRFRVDHIGMIFQQFNLIPYLSVIDNVLLPCRFSARRRQRALTQSATLRAEAGRLLTRLDLADEFRRRQVTKLSVGQQQRVAAARALIGQPEIVIADEPTSALDANRQLAFLDLLTAECRQTRATLIFVSHDVRLAARFSRTVALDEINRASETRAA